MQRLPKWNLTNRLPALYDTDSATVVEQTAKVYGAINALIDEYNTWVDRLNAQIEEFERATESDYETFKVAIRQEFQDFIDVIETNIQEQNARIESAENYMVSNIKATTEMLVNELITSGRITITEVYDDATESLNIVFEGGEVNE